MEGTIRLRIFLFGYLKDGVPENVRGQEWIEMPEGTTAQDLVEYLGVTRYHLGTILVNGAMAGPQQILVDGDQVKILPIVGGG
ncbi:MAG: MoaD/ThiS family protein [Coprothermobacterota bacterium]|nr:MoaD/ThiS family protein [Coprothermobacterota bacterium]